MKIIDRATFLEMPAGTLFQKYSPYVFEDLCIKGETTTAAGFFQVDLCGLWPADCNDTNDFCDALDRMRAGAALPLDLETECRDGLFDNNQLFAVWEARDVEALIARLGAALRSDAA
jgi:hypothetical protein